jgi:hypothetical protein
VPREKRGRAWPAESDKQVPACGRQASRRRKRGDSLRLRSGQAGRQEGRDRRVEHPASFGIKMATYRGWPLLGAILVQKSENVIGPDIGSKVAKGVAVSRGVAVGGINL